MADQYRPAASMICRPGCFILLVSLALLFFAALQAQGATGGQQRRQGGSRRSSTSWEGYVPVRSVVYRPPPASTASTRAEAAATYEAFEVCDGCRCCAASNTSSCVETSCCYGIDCNLPGKPFGTCAFTPLSCGCGAADNCTQQPS